MSRGWFRNFVFETFLVVARADDLSSSDVELGIRYGVFYFRIIVIIIVITFVVVAAAAVSVAIWR